MERVQEKDLVIVKGINATWDEKNFKEFKVGFPTSKTPLKYANYVALYLGSPDSKITHIAIVNKIDDSDSEILYYKFNTLIKLPKAIELDHQVRGFKYLHLKDLKITPEQIDALRVLATNYFPYEESSKK